MAKRLSFSHIDAQKALENLVGNTSREGFGYDLLRIFCGYGDASIKRIVDGKGNDAKDGVTLLVRKLLAYQPATAQCATKEDMFLQIETMQYYQERAAPVCRIGRNDGRCLRPQGARPLRLRHRCNVERL